MTMPPQEAMRKAAEEARRKWLVRQQQKPKAKTEPLPFEAQLMIEKEVQKAEALQHQKIREQQGRNIFQQMVNKGEIPTGSEYKSSKLTDKGVIIDYKPPEMVQWERAKPQDKFNILQTEGTIPEGAKFKGVTKKGEIEYELPAVTTVKITATPQLVAKGEDYIKSVAQLMKERHHLTQPMAEKLVTGRLKAEKKGYIEKKPVTEIKYDISKKSAEELKQEWKDAGVSAAEMLVPGVHTARNWGTMTAGEKAVSIGIDVGTVLIILFGPKVIGRGARVITGEARIVRLAKTAGKAGRELETKTKVYEKAFTSKYTKPETLTSIANKVEKARIKSLNADKVFLRKLERVKQVSSGVLKSLEKASGIKDFKKVIDDVGKATKDVSKAWKRVEKTKVNTTSHIKELDNLSNKQKGLEKALNNAGSVLKPRYSPKPPPSEFKGFKASWEKQKPKVSQHDMDDLQRWLDETISKTRLPPGGKAKPVMVRTKAVQLKGEKVFELKPRYGKVKPKPEKIAKTPKIERGKPGYAPRVDPVPREAYGRMTREQIARHYGEQASFDVRSKTVEESLVNIKDFSKIRAGEWASVRELVNAGVDAIPSPATKGVTKQQIKQAVDKAVDEKVSELAKAKTQIKPVTGPMVRTLTKTVVEKGTAKKFGKRGFIIRPGDDTEKKKRKQIKESLGAVTYRRGELQGKDVWHTYHVDKGGDLNRSVVVGPAPVGATLATGKGSTTTTLKRIRGKRLPNFTVLADTGAVDDLINAQGGKLTLSHVPDRISGGGMKRISNGVGRLSPKFQRLR